MNRIPCPNCGSRDLEEFFYGGDASLNRPSQTQESIDVWHDFVYLRDNPRGSHSELWYHDGGCRRWFKLQRDTLSHRITETVADKEQCSDEQH